MLAKAKGPANIVEHTEGLIFIGTLHYGEGKCTEANTLPLLQSVWSNRMTAEEITEQCKAIGKMNDNFTTCRLGIASSSFCETRKSSVCVWCDSISNRIGSSVF